MNFWEQEKKIEFLQGYQRSLNEERRILDSVQWIRMRYAVPSLKEMDGMPRGSGQSDLSDYIAKLSDLHDQYIKQLQHTLEVRVEILKAIREVANADEREVLHLRYIKLYKWQEVADAIGKGIRRTHDIHRNAIRSLTWKK